MDIVSFGYYVGITSCKLKLALQCYTIKTGNLYQISEGFDGSKKFSQYNPLKKTWVNSTSDFISDTNKSSYHWQNRIDFLKCTKKITKKEVDKMIETLTTESVMSVKDLESFIKSNNLTPDSRIKIIIMK